MTPLTPTPSPLWHAHIITLFPEMFPGHLGMALAGRAQAQWTYTSYNLRDFGHGRHRKVDDTPAGGGAGMVIRPDVACAAIDHVRARAPDLPLIIFTPRGTPLTQARIRSLAYEGGAILFCARFEGIDERVSTARNAEEISLGNFVLAGGEPAALCLMDATIRLLRGVMGNAASTDEESFSTNLLEYPHYTKPTIFENIPIPDVLRTGNHAKIAAWREAQAEAITRRHHPQLWRAYRAKPTPNTKK